MFARKSSSGGRRFEPAWAFLLVSFTSHVLGCTGLGPATISTGRSAYNSAIQRTSNEELLLNIVRLRYSDAPLFLRVTGVAANVSSQFGLDGGATFPGSGVTVANVGATARILDNPTVTYAPLQGDQFVTQLLTPVRVATLELLLESGWSIDRVFRLCVQRLNGVRNAPTASGPTPKGAPVFERFMRVSKLLGDLHRRDAIEFSLDAHDPQSLHMTFRGQDASSREALEFAELLDLDPEAGHYTLSTRSQTSPRDKNVIAIETRSLMGSLFYVSQAVTPPAAHQEKEWVTITRSSDGSAFDWRDVMEGLFEIRSTSRPSQETFLDTSYLGHSFTIDHRDLQSKATFELLNLLFALQAGSNSGSGPVLTLPVSK